MERLLDPMGLIAVTWDWTSAHGGAGVGAMLAAGIVALLHLAIAAAVLAVVVNGRGVAEVARGFAQGVNEPAGNRNG